MISWLGRYPGRTLQRLGSATAGIWLASTAISFILPEVQTKDFHQSTQQTTFNQKPLPEGSVTILLIGVDIEEFNKKGTRFFSKENTNANNIILFNIASYKPIRILQMPIELGINIPGTKEVRPLKDAYKTGGVYLTKDVITEILGIPEEEIKRYIIIPKQAIRYLTNLLKEREVETSNKPTQLSAEQASLVNPNSGANKINAKQIEEKILSNKKYSQASKRKWIRLFIDGLSKKFNDKEIISRLPVLLEDIQALIKTDLSSKEFESLIAASLMNDKPPLFRELPLAPELVNSELRQLHSKINLPFW